MLELLLLKNNVLFFFLLLLLLFFLKLGIMEFVFRYKIFMLPTRM